MSAPQSLGIQAVHIRSESLSLSPTLSRNSTANKDKIGSVIDVDALCETSASQVFESRRNQTLPGRSRKAKLVDDQIAKIRIRSRDDRVPLLNSVGHRDVIGTESEESVGQGQYDSETIRKLISVMKQCGYKDRRREKKTIKESCIRLSLQHKELSE